MTLTATARARALWPDLARQAVVALTVLALCWPALPVVTAFGFDRSWQYAMNWAVRLHAPWGTAVKWTYGPLGFLEYPLASSGVLLLAAVLSTAVALVLQVVVLSRLWCGVPPWRRAAVVVVSCLVLSVAAGDRWAADWGTATTPWLTLGVLSAVLCLRSTEGKDLIPLSAALGVLALMKATDALELLLLVVLVAVAGRAQRKARLLALTLPLAVDAMVLLQGGVSAVVGHAKATLALSGAYAGALGKVEPGRQWEVPVFGVAAVLVLGASTSVPALRRHRVVAVGSLAAVLLLGARAAFVRHDRHGLLAFHLLLLLAVPLLAVVEGWRSRLATILVVAVGAACVPLAGGPAVARLDRRPSIEALTEQLRLVSSPSRREQAHATALSDLLETSRMSPNTVALLRGQVATSDTFDVPLLDAVGARWVPLPVLAPLSAYTPALDRAQVEALEHYRPRVLRPAQPLAVDGRNPLWDAPQMQTALACRYRPLTSGADGWFVLAEGPTRCGAPRDLGVHQLRSGERLVVPDQPDALVVADLTPLPSRWERLRGAFTRPDVHRVVLAGQSARLPTLAPIRSVILRTPVALPGYDGRALRTGSAGDVWFDVPMHVRLRAVPFASAQGGPRER